MGIFTKKAAAPAAPVKNYAELSEAHYAAQTLVELYRVDKYQDTLKHLVSILPKQYKAQGWVKVEVNIEPNPDNPEDLVVAIDGHPIGHIYSEDRDSWRIPEGFDGWMVGALITFAKGGDTQRVAAKLLAWPPLTYS